jgi:trimethylamine:corrinoid methyltransferase-like protein
MGEGRRLVGENSRSWRANERARKILAEHHPKPLTDEQEREIERMVRDMEDSAVIR